MAYTNIDKSSDYFETVTYSGNGTGQDITTLDFQPDWLWIKRRDSVGSHRIQDSIRGTTNYLQSDKTDAEASGGDVDAFLSNGFSLSGGATAYNVSGGTYVGWSWLGGGTGSSNTDGSITSTVSANTTSGFSIVSYTGNGTAGATIGHGLGAVPSLILTKNRTSAYNWHLWTHAFSSYNDTIKLNTDAPKDTGTLLNNTAPTSSLITLGSSAVINESSSDQLAYVFAEKKGFSKFGSYVGNGNSDGTFVYTGFRPAFVIFKRSSGTQDWGLFDNKRSNYNPVDELIYPNYSLAESGDNANKFDFVSNGFKLRASGQQMNQSGDTYIYMAFAESPFVTSTGIPTTAR